jgi:hypothetical protein
MIPEVQARIFGGTYGVKRLQPGTVGPPAQVPSFGSVVSMMTHNFGEPQPEKSAIFGLLSMLIKYRQSHYIEGWTS